MQNVTEVILHRKKEKGIHRMKIKLINKLQIINDNNHRFVDITKSILYLSLM